MPRNSNGIKQLQKQAKLNSGVETQDTINLIKKFMKKLSQQSHDIKANFSPLLANDTKVRAGLEKSYENTKKLQQSVMTRLIKAVDAKRREMYSLKNVDKPYLPVIEAKLDEMKDLTSEIRPTIKTIHKKYKTNSIPRMDKLRSQITNLVRERLANTKALFEKYDYQLKDFQKNPYQIDKDKFKELRDTVDKFPEYGNSLKQSYLNGKIYINQNIAKFANIDTPTTQSFPISNNPTDTAISAACNKASEAVDQANRSMKKIQETGSTSSKTPSFLTEYLNKIEDPLLKMTFVFGAEHALITNITQYMNETQRQLKEYEQTASKLHTTAKDVAKKIGIGFLKMIPAIIGMATGLGSTLSVLTDLIESLGWFLNAVAYGMSDAAGIMLDREPFTLDQIALDQDSTSNTMFTSVGIKA